MIGLTARRSLLYAMVLTLGFGVSGRASAQTWIEWPVSEGGNGHQYRLTDIVGPWVDAEAEAAVAGGHLATVNDAAENQWLFENFAQPSNIWIGFYQDLDDPDYSEPSGAWKWISGETVTYTNWISGEPNDNGSEHWAQMKGSDSVWDGQWNDVGDQSALRGVIEIPEPATLSLLLLGCLVALQRKR